jgi:uncharacterized protein YraI
MLKRLALAALVLIGLGTVGLAVTETAYAQSFTGNNWNGQYFSNANFAPPAAFSKIDQVINFNFGAGSPSDGVTTLPVDNFSVRWTGLQTITTPATYQFTVIREDDAQVTVNGVVIIPFANQDVASPQVVTGSLFLNAGQASITVEFINRTGNASINFFYQLIGTGGQTQIPGIFTPTITLTSTRTALPAIPPGALTATVIKASVLNTRDAPTTGGRKLGQILRGETYAVLGRTEDARWFLLQLGGYQAWSYGFYLYVNGNEYNAPISSPFGTLGVPGGYPDTGTVAQSIATLVLRDVPSVAGNQIGRVTWGGFLPVVGKSGDGYWFQVVWKGTVGWVYSPYTKITQGDLNAVPVR